MYDSVKTSKSQGQKAVMERKKEHNYVYCLINIKE